MCSINAAVLKTIVKVEGDEYNRWFLSAYYVVAIELKVFHVFSLVSPHNNLYKIDGVIFFFIL